MMDLDTYQKTALNTLMYNTEQHLTYGLAAEVGEVMSLMQKTARHDTRYWSQEDDVLFGEYTPLLKELMFSELGDCLWYLACLANYHGFPLSAIAQHNLEKLDKRKAEGKIQGDGDKR
jgi:NTP pyrophosphatase (non-canonical NTP hydrolase)